MRQLRHFFFVALMVLTGAPAQAYNFVVDGIYYSLYGTELVVSNSERSSGIYPNDYSGDLVIPASVTYGGKTYKVKGIDTFVFRGCDNLHSVTLPGSMAKVDNYAFAYCASIEEVIISEGTTSVGYYAFAGCTNLKNVSIPQGLTTIGSNAFDGCTGLEHISLSGVSEISSYVFKGCTSLSSVTIPASVTYIGSHAFENCTGLESVTFDGTLDNIGPSVFQGCSSLASITVPEGVTEIEEKAFYGCTALATVSLPESMTVIGKQAFAYCTALHNINLPHNLTTVGQAAFNMCGNDLSLTIPANITSMGTYAFACGSGLTSVTIEEGLSEIGESMFDGCSSLIGLTLPESITSIGKTAFQGCSGLTSITIPSQVAVIDYGTFWGCSGLVEVELPQGLTAIGEKAFYCCTHLPVITLPASLQSIGGDAFLGCWAMKTVYNASMLNIVHGSEGYGRVAQLADVVYIGMAHMYDGNSTLHELEEYNWTKIPGATAKNALLFINRQWDEEIGANIVSRTAADNEWHASTINITDAEPFYCHSDVAAENLTYTRTFGSTDWQALYIPFNISYDEWAGKAEVAEIMGVHTYDRNDDGVIDESFIEFKKLKDGAELLPNTPYVIKPASTGEVVFTCSNKTLAATPAEDGKVWCASTRHKYTLTGLYQETPITGNYALVNGTFRKITSSYPQYPNRFYLTIEDVNNGYGAASASQAPQRVRIMVDGEVVTGIEDVNSEANDAACYDLSGRRIAKPTHGIYIKNGKKLFNVSSMYFNPL